MYTESTFFMKSAVSLYVSIYLSIYLFIHLPVWTRSPWAPRPRWCLYIYLSIYLSIYLFIYPYELVLCELPVPVDVDLLEYLPGSHLAKPHIVFCFSSRKLVKSTVCFLKMLPSASCVLYIVLVFIKIRYTEGTVLIKPAVFKLTGTSKAYSI